MRKSEKRIVMVEIIRGIGFMALLFLIFWGQAQLIDPNKLFLITKVPWEVALPISIIFIIGAIVSEEIAPNKEQTIKQIKKGKDVHWTF